MLLDTTVFRARPAFLLFRHLFLEASLLFLGVVLDVTLSSLLTFVALDIDRWRTFGANTYLPNFHDFPHLHKPYT